MRKHITSRWSFVRAWRSLPACTNNLINLGREDYLGGISNTSRLNKTCLGFMSVARDISTIAGYLIFSLSLLTTGVAREFITRVKRSRHPWRGRKEAARTLGDIFFLNSFAGDYSSAITALTKREAAQNRGRSVPSQLPFYISNGDFTASGARLWRDGGKRKRGGKGKEDLSNC